MSTNIETNIFLHILQIFNMGYALGRTDFLLSSKAPKSCACQENLHLSGGLQISVESQRPLRTKHIGFRD